MHQKPNSKNPLPQNHKQQRKEVSIDHKQALQEKRLPPGLNLEVLSDSTNDDSTTSSPKQLSLSGIDDLRTFKTLPCTKKMKHNHKKCIYYHYPRDRKRPGHTTSNRSCKHFVNPESCPRGDDCPDDHSRVEQLYNPDKYKMRFCSFYPNNLDRCEFGDYCSFAHSEAELRIQLIEKLSQENDEFFMNKYKTEGCPYNLISHDKASCVYYHNWQDYRRKPTECDYKAQLCPYWGAKAFLTTYEDSRCPLLSKCKECHGWKELEYHPMRYKTKSCTLKKCLGGRVCPYYHSDKDKREVSTAEYNNLNKQPAEDKNMEVKTRQELEVETVKNNRDLSIKSNCFGVEEAKRNDDSFNNSVGQRPKHASIFDSIWTYTPEKPSSLRYQRLAIYVPLDDKGE